MQPAQATNLCAGVTCQTGYVCDPNTGNCVVQNPGSSTFTLTINSTDTSNAPLSGMSATLDASTVNSQIVTLPISKTLGKGGHTVTVPASQTVGSIKYDFGYWADLAVPNNTALARAITLTSDITITAVFKATTLGTLTLAAQVQDASSGRWIGGLAVPMTLSGASIAVGTSQLPAGSYTLSTPATTTVTIGGSTTVVNFLGWTDGVNLTTRTITVQGSVSFTAQYCCIGGRTV